MVSSFRPPFLFQSPLGEACFYRCWSGRSTSGSTTCFNPHSGKPAFTGCREGNPASRDRLSFNPHSGKPAFTGCSSRGKYDFPRGFQSPLGEACFYRHDWLEGLCPDAAVSIPTRGSLLLQASGKIVSEKQEFLVSIPTRGSLLLQARVTAG